MSKYIDKNQLPQYKYFNSCAGEKGWTIDFDNEVITTAGQSEDGFKYST